MALEALEDLAEGGAEQVRGEVEPALEGPVAQEARHALNGDLAINFTNYNQQPQCVCQQITLNVTPPAIYQFFK